MFVDLDRFKTINDSLGHAAGDAAAEGSRASASVKQLRVGDTICRIGGDEFVVVLPEIKRASDVAPTCAAKIIETVSQPFSVEERELHVTPSIGISVFPDDGRDAETPDPQRRRRDVPRQGDRARQLPVLHRADEPGGVAPRSRSRATCASAVLQGELRAALPAGRRDATAASVVAHEALLRWQHPTRGVIGPAEFIQLAEDTGLILRIGEWVLGEACRWAELHRRRARPAGERQPVGAPVQRSEAGRAWWPRAARDRPAAGSCSSSRSPEPAAMQHADLALAALKKLQELGVSGGHRRFRHRPTRAWSACSQLPVDKLKIDRTLVADGASRDGKPIVAGIVGLAHALGSEGHRGRASRPRRSASRSRPAAATTCRAIRIGAAGGRAI